MLRNLISDETVVEIYKFADEVKRGAVVVKDYTNKVVKKASGVGTEVFIADFDYQPTGYKAGTLVSDYTDEADIIKENSLGLLKKYSVRDHFATDQVDITTAIVSGDYLIAGTTTKAGLLVKATTGAVTTFRYVGTYSDAGHTLYEVEVVEPHTVA